MNIYYEQHSQLSKQDTLFLHGNLASHRWWHPTLQEWKKAGSMGSGSLVFSDWRGCGKNEDWPQGKPFQLKDLAQDQLDLLHKLKLKDVALVGHSLGGLIALQMMTMEPELFSRALLLDPVGVQGVIFDDSMYDAFKQMAENPELTRMVILSTVLNADQLNEEWKEKVTADALKAVRGIGSSVLEILKSVDLRGPVARIQIPTLILHGAKDQIIPLADSEQLSQLMSHSKLEILTNQGHCWNVEDSEAFTQRLRQWL